MSYEGKFERNLRARIGQEIETRTGHLLNSSAVQSYEDFKYKQGMLNALQMVLQYCDEVGRETNEE